MSYINKPLGGTSAMVFSIGGINQVALIEKSKVLGLEELANNPLPISGLTLASGATFQDVNFIAKSATLEEEQVKTTTSHYITQKLKFSVLTEDNETSQTVLLGRQYVALVRKNNGVWKLVGRDNGLTCSVYTSMSSADDASRTYEMTADNLGDTSTLDMSDSAIQALINKAV